MKPTRDKPRFNTMQKPQLFKHSAKELNLKLKATVQKNLNLGFTSDTINMLGLKEGMGIVLQTEGEIPTKNIIYMQVIPDAKADEHAFRINKAGGYCYANTKKFFKKLFKGLGLDENRDANVIYDLNEVDFDGEKFWELTGREVAESDKDDEQDQE